MEFKVKRMGKITAYKYKIDEYGKKTPLRNWKIAAKGKDQTGKDISLYQFTDSSGKAEFIVDPGKWLIEEEVKKFYINDRNNPRIRERYVKSGDTKVYVEFVNYLPPANLTVFKFEDSNGEQRPIVGWTFFVDDKKINVSKITDINGIATFKLYPQDETQYVITEKTETNWICTTQNPITITLVPGQSGRVDFVNKKVPGEIRIHKFRDFNRNGAREETESYVSWPFRISGIQIGGAKNITTSSSGPTIMTLPPGRYTIDELPKSNLSCWKPTTPTTRTIDVVSGAVVDVWFGNVLEQEIRILKFNDSNRNGKRDTGEEGLPDWIFTAKNKGTGETKTVGPTDKNGMVVFKSSPDNTYEITEFIKSGWISTTPRQQTIAMNSEQCFIEAEFGNAPGIPVPQGSINITKYYDKNESKSWEKGEILLEGWEFEIINLASRRN